MNGVKVVTMLAGGALALFFVAGSDTERLPADEQVIRDTATTEVALLQERAEGETKKKKRAAPRGRLPNNYGQIGISEKQRETIYGIQSKYREQMEELVKQLTDLRSKRDAEIEDVLTDEQKKKLAELRAASKRGTTSKPAASGESAKSSE